MAFVTVGGLTVPEEALDLIDSDRKWLASQCRRQSVAPAVKACTKLYQKADDNIAQAVRASGERVACSKGCAYCCRGVKVNISALEAVTIAQSIGNDSEMRASAEAAAKRRRDMNVSDLYSAVDPCPFLSATNECRIYEVRPFACRRYFALRVEECRTANTNPKRNLPVVFHLQALAVGGLAATIVAAALEDANLDFRQFELSSAVAVALRDGLAAMWVAGLPVFDGAVRKVDATDIELESKSFRRAE